MTDDKAERIQKGIAFLDKNNPGWENKIDTGLLQLSDCTRCVLGQTLGDFWQALDVICEVPTRNSRYHYDTEEYAEFSKARSVATRWAQDHGFMLSEKEERDNYASGTPYMEQWETLTADWVTAIEKHRVRENVE